MDDFLRDLRAKGAADLNSVLATLNEGGLCREAQEYWVRQGWVVVSPSTPLQALAGPLFSRGLSLRRFCGEEEEETAAGPATRIEVEESDSDDDS